MRLFLGDFGPDAFDLLVHLGNIFVQFLDRYRIEIPLRFRHVLRKIVVFLHPESPLTGLASVPPSG